MYGMVQVDLKDAQAEDYVKVGEDLLQVSKVEFAHDPARAHVTTASDGLTRPFDESMTFWRRPKPKTE